jgi:prepilin-type N-terminal cleavage/methylation domain-containing protein
MQERSFAMTRCRRGFTLIELLIVVGIISILAAIALPNFLEAQVRSKLARIKSDLRTVSIAWEAYAVDNDRYPVDWDNNPIGIESTQIGMIQVTTPVAYLTTFPIDPFSVMRNPNSNEFAPHFEAASCSYAYCIYSLGPNFLEEFDGNDQWPDGTIDGTPGRVGQMFTGPICMRPYDPTNGVISDGDVHRLGGDWRGHDRAADQGGPWQIWGISWHVWGNVPTE